MRTEANGTIAVGMTLQELGQSVISGKMKAAELVNGYLQRIAARNPEINAYLSVASEDARRTAEDLDAAARRGDPLGSLAGVPVAIKDVIAIEGMTATAGSRILEGYKPPYTATAVRRLKEAGAVVLGKLNCDEFAMGSSNENSAYGVVRNPVAPRSRAGRLERRLGGGSRGGVGRGYAWDGHRGVDSAAGVVLRCGGCLPTYGRVSRYGLIAFASSLDRIGPFARTVEDAATVLGVIAGHDPLDATSSRQPVPDYVAECHKPVEGLRVGVPAEYFAEGLDPEVEARGREGDRLLARAGLRRSRRCRCRTPATRCLRTTCWRRRRRALTWSGSTACATAIARQK